MAILRRFWQGLVALLGLVVAACAPLRERPPSPPTPPSEPAQQPPGPVQPGVSRARTVDAYKVDVAEFLQRSHAAWVYPGKPPNPLKSIVILKLTVNRQGQATARMVRSNGFKNLEDRALQTVRLLAQLPTPPAHLLQAGRLEFQETWLFNDEGRFQLRSVAAEQEEAE